MEYYFDRDDRLERKKYAEFLETLLLNCDKYRREDSDGAYVIALDSPWGTGKTRFVKMLRNYLEDRTSEAEKNRPIGKEDEPLPPGENAKFNVVYYNSWETDYWNDALEPLICSIMDSRVLEVEGAEDDNNKIRDVILRILKGMGVALVKLALGDPAGSVFQGAIDGLSEIPDDPLAEYKERMGLYSDFRETLRSAIKRTNKKLVIIIDELDRCRPTFAIQTLELAKHLFAVPGLIFIFSLDIKQLGYSVGTVYSTEMDSIGYLRRFFDYLIRMPAGNKKVLITDLVETINIDGLITRRKSNYMRIDPRDELIGFIFELAQKASISLRDITTIFESFRLMFDVFLENYRTLEAAKIYFILLLIKYKYIDLFNTLFSNQDRVDNFSVYIKQELGFTLRSEILERVEKIYDCGIIKLRAFRVIDFDGNFMDGAGNIFSVENETKDSVVIKWRLNQPGVPEGHPARYPNTICLDDILYIPDLRKWEQIKDLTLAQYYHRQLEMFDFVLPADEAKIEP